MIDIKELIQLAKQGDAEAQYQLGQCYARGKYVEEKDEITAVFWFKQSAAQGNEKGQFCLGKCYLLGYGTAENKELALHWLSEAASKNYSRAVFYLGICYMYAYDPTKNLIDGLNQIGVAGIMLEDLVAQHFLGYYYASGIFELDLEQAEYYWSEAAKQNHIHAWYRLIYMNL